MNANKDFKELWLKQEISPVPDMEDLVKKANKFKTKTLVNSYIMNFLFGLTTIFVIFIWSYFQPEMITTKIGIVLTILSMLSFVVANNRTFHLLKQEDFQMNSDLFLTQLIKLKEKQVFIQKTMLTFFFILFSTGIALYLIEYVMRMPLTWAIATCCTTAIWITFNWFYIRPRSINKQQGNLNDLIRRFENLNTQFNSEG